MTCPLDLYDRVAGIDNLERTLANLTETANEREWHEESDHVEATPTTPLGFTLSLAYLPKWISGAIHRSCRVMRLANNDEAFPPEACR